MTLSRIHAALVVMVVYFGICVLGVGFFSMSFGLMSSEPVLPGLFSAHDSLGIAGVGIALSTSVGSYVIKHVDAGGLGAHAVGIVSQAGRVGNMTDSLIADHFDAIDTYRNVLSTNIVTLLGRSSNRAASLDAFIDELSFRRADAVNRLADMSVSQDAFSDRLNSIDSQVAGEQARIGAAYDSRDESQINEAIVMLADLRTEAAELRTQLAFMQRFQADYESLIASTDPYLRALQSNRGALVSGVTVTVPDSGGAILQNLGILQIGN